MGGGNSTFRCVVVYRDIEALCQAGVPIHMKRGPLGGAKAGVWYFIAREPEKGYRTFRAQRIADVDELAHAFERPTDFNLEAYWNESVLSIERKSFDASYDVVIRLRTTFVSKLAPYWDTVVEHEDAATTTLRIAFPTRDVAIVQLERARRAIETFALGAP